MNRIVRAVVLALVFAVISLNAEAYGFPSGYTWYTANDFEKAKVEAQKTGKKILFVLGSGRSCSGCNYVMGQLGTEELRPIYEPNFIHVYVDWQSPGGLDLWYRYTPDWRSVPNFVLLDPKGEGICRAAGAFNVGRLDGLALGKKMVSLNTPAGVDLTKFRLPECSLMK
jgi:thioredoxin-related protein